MLEAAPAKAAEEDFHRGVAALGSADAPAGKEAAALAIVASGHARAETVLSAFVEGALYTTRADDRVVLASDADSGYAILDAITGEDLGTVGRRDVSRVTVNNQLRGALRSMLASLKLKHEDPDERSAAIREVGESEDLAMLPVLEELLETEQNGGVRDAIAMAIATLNLDSTDAAARLAAVEAVGSQRQRARAHEAHGDRRPTPLWTSRCVPGAARLERHRAPRRRSSSSCKRRSSA